MSKISPKNYKTEKRLTAEKTVILIRLVKKYKSLWDSSNPDFRNITVCNYLYDKIGRYFQLSGSDVRRKFLRLRNSYRQELKLIRDGQKSYTNMFYFDEMEFLKEQIEHRRLGINSLNISTTPSTEEDGDLERVSAESEELCNIDIVDDQLSNESDPTASGIVVEELEDVDEMPSGKEEQNEHNSNISEEKSDEFDIFAGYLASQLREMDKLSALETMEELQQIISKRRIRALKKDLINNTGLKVKYRYSLKRRKEDNDVDVELLADLD